MNWYWIILLMIFYIVMWTITAIAFSRWSKNTDAGWLVVGALWPLVLCVVPFVSIICVVEKIVNKYGYKEDK